MTIAGSAWYRSVASYTTLPAWGSVVSTMTAHIASPGARPDALASWLSLSSGSRAWSAATTESIVSNDPMSGGSFTAGTRPAGLRVWTSDGDVCEVVDGLSTGM